MAHEAAAVLQSSPRARRRRAKVERILEAAMEMVAEGGLDALSMARLADEVDYTPGALYRYFRSKDALYAALVAQVIGRVHALASEVAGWVPGERPLARVLVVTEAYRRFAEREPHRFGLLSMTMAEPRILLKEADDASAVAGSMSLALEDIGRTLAEAEALGALAPGRAEERTLLLYASLQGVLQLRKQARMAPLLIDVTALSRALVRTLLLGWGATADALDRAAAEVASLADLDARLDALLSHPTLLHPSLGIDA